MSNRGAIGVDRGKNPAGSAGLHGQAIGSGLPIVILHGGRR